MLGTEGAVVNPKGGGAHVAGKIEQSNDIAHVPHVTYGKQPFWK